MGRQRIGIAFFSGTGNTACVIDGLAAALAAGGAGVTEIPMEVVLCGRTTVPAGRSDRFGIGPAAMARAEEPAARWPASPSRKATTWTASSPTRI